ncbi:MAG: VOC family protein [Pseudomonadota bacterium]
MAQALFAISLVVPDYDPAIAFYVGKLGWTLDQDEDLPNGKRWVRITPPGADAGSLILARAEGAQQISAIGNQTGGRVGFFLQTDDFYRDFENMIAAGVGFEEAPRVEPYGTVAVWRDPFGNRWDLLQFS